MSEQLSVVSSCVFAPVFPRRVSQGLECTTHETAEPVDFLEFAISGNDGAKDEIS